MAFAPYYNTPGMQEPALLGIIQHAETLAQFEYSKRPAGDRGGIWWDQYGYRIFTRDGDRMARILKTVAYVVIDEDPDGQPVVEKWPLRKHRTYAPLA